MRYVHIILLPDLSVLHISSPLVYHITMSWLNRKRSTILKFIVVISLLWFTVAFFLLRDISVTVTEQVVQKFTNHSTTSRSIKQLELPSMIPGAGDNGLPYHVNANADENIKNLVSEGWQKNAFNQYVSDVISLHRRIPDKRNDWCKEPGRFLADLPTTSVIIIFHNEAWSTLLRTVYSVLDNSPSHLIKEIILVDDASTMDHLKKPLDSYVQKLSQVKIIHSEKREGLIRARLLGSDIATGQVLTFLDSHCECTTGWLEPLLDRIARDKTTVVCPVIDGIDDTTFSFTYATENSISVGTFDFGLTFHWMSVPQRERNRRNHLAEPLRSATMAGGLFSIDKEYFEKLGRYDEGFDIWGCENLELSFKIWMCGGTLEILPCSHVGHIFRKRSPYDWGQQKHVLRRNPMRLAYVWLDEYKDMYLQRIGGGVLADMGDISSRLALRESLNCKSFKWYLETIIPEANLNGKIIVYGEVRNMGKGGNFCLDMSKYSNDKKNLAKAAIYPCHKQGGNQFFTLLENGEFGRDTSCLDYHHGVIYVEKCHGQGGNQIWRYEDSQIRFNNGQCLALYNGDVNKLVLEQCNSSLLTQKWDINSLI